MTIIVILIAIGLGLAITSIIRQRKSRKTRENLLGAAVSAGLALDDDGNINAGLTCASMRAREEISGLVFNGRQQEFLKLLQLVSEGPQSVDEIRFLLKNGFEAIVRPDGLVYVPCIENEHLSMPGEISLEPEDLHGMEDEPISGGGAASRQ